jgi:hypothetical protein
MPSHASAESHTDAEARHTAPAAARTSTHTADEPLHVSAMSHGPADARHTAPAFPGVDAHVPALQRSTVHALLSLQSASFMHWHDQVPTQAPAPLHRSLDVQLMPSLHACVAGAGTLAGQALLEPEQTAGSTQLLVAARHTTLADSGTIESAGHVLSTPLHDSLRSHGPPVAAPRDTESCWAPLRRSDTARWRPCTFRARRRRPTPRGTS